MRVLVLIILFPVHLFNKCMRKICPLEGEGVSGHPAFHRVFEKIWGFHFPTGER